MRGEKAQKLMEFYILTLPPAGLTKTFSLAGLTQVRGEVETQMVLEV